MRAEPTPTPPFAPVTASDIASKVRSAVAAADDRKAVDLKVLHLEKVTDFTDYFLICSGTNERQVQAIADGIEERLKKEGSAPLHVEGHRTGQWVLLDYADLVVHVFLEERRGFYGLERLWSHAPDVSAELRG